jgi:hypothetical protein
MTKYYFVGTLLPALSFDLPLEITLEELERLLRENLTERDFEKTGVIRRFYDMLNLRAFWREEPLDPRGELSELDLSEALVSGVGLPDYVYSFIEQYPNKEERLRHFPFLLTKFFKTAQEDKDSFLHRYFQFERELRLVMTAFRAKKLGRDLSIELQYEDPEEDLIAQLLALQDAKVYEPPEKFLDLKLIFDKYGGDPLALQKALDEYRFEKIESFVDLADVFSIERILAYLLQFMLVEKWSQMDHAKGIEIVRMSLETGVKKGT